VQVSRTIPAPREQVFRAWTDPDRVKQWFGGPLGSAHSAEMDVRAGGTYRINFTARPPLPSGSVVGTYLEVEPPERLVSTFEWESEAALAGLLGRALALPHEGGESRLTVEFSERDGSTEVRITHELLDKRRNRSFHRVGWNHSLDKFASMVAGGP
jgi:uncharacterized protein YndB with AHSA1/START domain